MSQVEPFIFKQPRSISQIVSYTKLSSTSRSMFSLLHSPPFTTITFSILKLYNFLFGFPSPVTTIVDLIKAYTITDFDTTLSAIHQYLQYASPLYFTLF